MTHAEKQQELVQLVDVMEWRWQDEKKYEDFDLYREAARRKCEQLGMRFVKLTQVPFRLTYLDGKYEKAITIKKDGVTLTSKPKRKEN